MTAEERLKQDILNSLRCNTVIGNVALERFAVKLEAIIIAYRSSKDDRADETDTWISVKDRLPEEFQHVIVFDGNDVTDGIVFTENSFYMDYWSDYQLKINGVEKWQPLPKPPVQSREQNDKI